MFTLPCHLRRDRASFFSHHGDTIDIHLVCIALFAISWVGIKYVHIKCKIFSTLIWAALQSERIEARSSSQSNDAIILDAYSRGVLIIGSPKEIMIVVTLIDIQLQYSNGTVTLYPRVFT